MEVYVFPRRRSGKKVEGHITKVIQRKKTSFVGIVQMHPNFAFVLPSDHRMYTDIFVPKDRLDGASDGDKVIVSINVGLKRLILLMVQLLKYWVNQVITIPKFMLF